MWMKSVDLDQLVMKPADLDVDNFEKKTMHTVDFLDCHEYSKLTIHRKYHAIIVMCEKKSNQTK